MFTSLSIQRRRYVCPVCGIERIIETKGIEKSVVVDVHPDTRGTFLPVIMLREEGEVVRD